MIERRGVWVAACIWMHALGESYGLSIRRWRVHGRAKRAATWSIAAWRCRKEMLMSARSTAISSHWMRAAAE